MSSRRRRVYRRKKRRYRRIFIINLFLIFSLISLIKIVNICSGLIKSPDARMVSSDINLLEDTDVFTVCIDPGHGDWDVGAIGVNGSYEKDIVLDIALIVGELLENSGLNVVYTRNNDTLNWSDDSIENLYERVRISKDNNADLFISIHCNSAYDYSEYKCLETWYNPKSKESKALASLIQDELSNLEYTNDRGIKFYSDDAPLAVLNNNDAPSALIELGFLSNWSDENILTSKIWQKNIAEAICNAILSYKDLIE